METKDICISIHETAAGDAVFQVYRNDGTVLLSGFPGVGEDDARYWLEDGALLGDDQDAMVLALRNLGLVI